MGTCKSQSKYGHVLDRGSIVRRCEIYQYLYGSEKKRIEKNRSPRKYIANRVVVFIYIYIHVSDKIYVWHI